MPREVDITPKGAKPNIYQRMLAIMTDATYLQKDKVESFHKYKYVSHDQVTAKMRAHCIKHGVYPAFEINQHTVEMGQNDKGKQTQFVTIEGFITFVNADDPEDKFVVSCMGQGIDTGDKATGKAISYAFKYGLLKGFMLETGDDPDHDQDVELPESNIPAEDAQIKLIEIRKERMAELGQDLSAFDGWLHREFGTHKPYELTRAQAVQVISALDRKLKEVRNG